MATNEIVNYIKEELQKGTPKEQITSNLLSKGWTQDSVNEALASATGTTDNTPLPPAAIPSPVPNPVQQQYYVQSVPVEPTSKHPGRIEGIIAIGMAVVALIIIPPAFGAGGIVLGALARKKGQKTLGLVAIILSAVFTVCGLIIGAVAYQALKNQSTAKGLIGVFFAQ